MTKIPTQVQTALGGRHRAPASPRPLFARLPVVVGQCGGSETGAGSVAGVSEKVSGQANYALPLNPTRRLLLPRPSTSPTSPFVPPRSFCGLMPTWCASVSALDPSPSPIALSARGSCACEPRLIFCASVWWNYSRRPTCQEPKEPHRHDEAHSPNLFSPPSTSTQRTPVPLDLSMNSPSRGIVI